MANANQDTVQARLIRNTGNGPTVVNEEELLRAMFGEPDEDGIYGVPEGGDDGDC